MMDPIVYADHLALKTVEDLGNYLNLFNSQLKLRPAPHQKIREPRGSLKQVDIDHALQEAGLHYSFDGFNYHILRRNLYKSS